MDFRKLFLDMDSFFASVEQQVQPPLREIPVVVAPYTGATGCVISAAKTAKKCGVKTGMLVGEAKKVCPQLKIIESRPYLYQFYHKELINLLQSFTPFLKVLSIDEMVFPLQQKDKNEKQTRKIAEQIKQRMKEKIGDFLTCSIGVGPNQFLAKVAAESNKPDALVLLKLDELSEFYQKLKLLDLPGINTRMESVLNKVGIKTPLDFYNASQDKLTRFFNYPGKMWYLRLRGFEVDDFKSRTQVLGHSFVLPPKYRTWDGAKKSVVKLASKVGYRLRKEGFLAKALSLSINFLNGESKREYINCDSFSDNHSVINHALYLFEKIPFSSNPILIYLTAFKLTKSQKQDSLFESNNKRPALSKAMDKINDKFGNGTIDSAEILDSPDLAPNRIPFGKPRYEMG